MENNKQLENLLSSLEKKSPREGLFFDIILAINEKRQFLARMKIAVSSALIIIFSVNLVIFWNSALNSLVKSETGSLLSLFFTDSGLILANWKSYALYLLESLPIMPIMLILIGIFILLLSIKLLIEGLAGGLRLMANKQII